MTTHRTTLDPLLKTKNVQVEPEELIEPESETEAEVKPGRLSAFKARLNHYGNRALGSATHFFTTFRDALVNIGTALGGSVIVLPIIVLLRGPYVLLRVVFTSAKDVFLSVARALFDALRIPFQGLYNVFSAFNKQVLFPVMKRAKEDDTFAVVAFLILVAVVVAGYVVVRQFIL